MEINGHLPADISARILRNELIGLDGWDRELVIPEGVETIRENAIRRPGTNALRRRIIFPATIGQLTWKQVRDVGNADIVLPTGYFERSGDPLDTALLKGWEEEPLSLGRLVRVYLERKQDSAAFAQALLQPDALPEAAKIMVEIVRQKPRVLNRAVVFFVRHAQHIPRETAAKLVKAAPGKFRARTRRDDPARREDAIYDPVLLDYILQMIEVDPMDVAFGKAVDTAAQKKAHPYSVKCAIVPYVAEALDVGLPSQPVANRSWVRYVDGADAAASTLAGLDDVLRAIMPGPAEMAESRMAPIIVAYGRYDNSGRAANYLMQVRAACSALRVMVMADTGLMLNDSRPAFDQVQQQERDGRYTLERYIEMRYTNPMHAMLPDTFVEDGETLRAEYECSGVPYELRIGPELKFRWRPKGESRWMSGDRLADMWHEHPREHKQPFFRVAPAVNSFVQVLSDEISRHLQYDYLSGRARTAREVRHLCEDPLLRQAVQGVVWDQDGRTFTSQNGAITAADGAPYVLSDLPVRLAHVMDLAAQEVDAWREYFDRAGQESWMGQMDELNYRDVPIAPDRYSGFELKPTYTRRKSSIPVITVGQYNEVRVYADSVVLYFSDDYRHPSKYPKTQSVKLLAMDRRANRILHQMDLWSLEYRTAKNDATIVPLLERQPVKQLKKLLETAREAKHPEMTARLLKLVEERTTKRDTSRFSLRKS